jgi:hypothetical protein
MFPEVRNQLLAGVSKVCTYRTRFDMDMPARSVDRLCVERCRRNNVSCWDKSTLENVELSICVKHSLLQAGQICSHK